MNKLEFNIRDMAEFAKSRNINLRPHIKTHKSPDIARMQINQGALGIACAKIGEAQIMAAHNIGIFMSFIPLLVEEKLKELSS